MTLAQVETAVVWEMFSIMKRSAYDWRVSEERGYFSKDRISSDDRLLRLGKQSLGPV